MTGYFAFDHRQLFKRTRKPRHAVLIDVAGSNVREDRPCLGDGCWMCRSTAEDRARIAFVGAPR